MTTDPELTQECRIGCPVRAGIFVDFLVSDRDIRHLCDIAATRLVLREVVLDTCPLLQAAKYIIDSSEPQ
jgi:hypothetical protein